MLMYGVNGHDTSVLHDTSLVLRSIESIAFPPLVLIIFATLQIMQKIPK